MAQQQRSEFTPRAHTVERESGLLQPGGFARSDQHSAVSFCSLKLMCSAVTGMGNGGMLCLTLSAGPWLLFCLCYQPSNVPFFISLCVCVMHWKCSTARTFDIGIGGTHTPLAACRHVTPRVSAAGTLLFLRTSIGCVLFLEFAHSCLHLLFLPLANRFWPLTLADNAWMEESLAGILDQGAVCFQRARTV